LAEWVLAAREQLARCNRLEIGDEKIGEVLARSPVGLDGIWPAEPVRDLIEQLESRDLEDGISLGVYNSRGMTSRAMMEGGIQERDLERRYRIWSEATANRWPRTSRVLRKIADSFSQDGRRWDDSADRDELRWG
jgi:hypothetical protein